MEPQATDHLALAREDGSSSCPSCGHEAIETTQIDHRFLYGDGNQATELSAMVPLRRCRDCGFEFLDSVAEERQHDAVCRHLGVMTPAEIRQIRQKAGSLSRGEFAKISRVGEASLGRWERGELIQNAANDQLLYLLTFPENLNRLRERLQRKNLPESLAPDAAAGLSSSALSQKTR